MRRALLAAALLALVASARAQLGPCDVANFIYDAGVDPDAVPVMVCIAYYESSWDPDATNEDSDGSTDYGLWQINNNYWCNDPNFPGKANGCDVDCDQLFDGPTNAQCAAIVLDQQGFTAWAAYNSHQDSCDNYELDCSNWVPRNGSSSVRGHRNS